MISPERAVDSIHERYGRHPGARALHAKGILLRGTFTATPDAAGLTRAPHMQGDPVPALARLSNGSGNPRSRDGEPDVRGLAVSFELPDGARTDISAQTVPHFPVRTPDEFIALLRAAAPGIGRIWRLPVFLARHPRVLSALRENAAGLKPPASYATRPYYGVHAFRWVNKDGDARHVRYTWLPEAHDPPDAIPGGDRGPDALREELLERLGRGPVRFTLQLQLAAAGDPVDDPSKLWPDDRETVSAGTLELAETYEGDDTHVFDPMRLTDGIEASDDPVLRFRPQAYSVSVERRTA